MPIFPSPIETANRYLLVGQSLEQLFDRMGLAGSVEAEMLSYGGVGLGVRSFVLGSLLRFQIAKHPELIPGTLRGELCTSDEIARIVCQRPLEDDGFALELFR
jgi:hypothetical protein